MSYRRKEDPQLCGAAQGRFGKGAVTAVLRGSTAKQVLDNHLDKLSTYGLLCHMSQEDTTAYVKALIQAGCISVQQGATRQ